MMAVVTQKKERKTSYPKWRRRKIDIQVLRVKIKEFNGKRRIQLQHCLFQNQKTNKGNEKKPRRYTKHGFCYKKPKSIMSLPKHKLEKCRHAFFPTMRSPSCQERRRCEGQTKHLLHGSALLSEPHKLRYNICAFYNLSRVLGIAPELVHKL